jgi:hypothetical protein
MGDDTEIQAGRTLGRVSLGLLEGGPPVLEQGPSSNPSPCSVMVAMPVGAVARSR